MRMRQPGHCMMLLLRAGDGVLDRDALVQPVMQSVHQDTPRNGGRFLCCAAAGAALVCHVVYVLCLDLPW